MLWNIRIVLGAVLHALPRPARLPLSCPRVFRAEPAEQIRNELAGLLVSAFGTKYLRSVTPLLAAASVGQLRRFRRAARLYKRFDTALASDIAPRADGLRLSRFLAASSKRDSELLIRAMTEMRVWLAQAEPIRATERSACEVLQIRQADQGHRQSVAEVMDVILPRRGSSEGRSTESDSDDNAWPAAARARIEEQATELEQLKSELSARDARILLLLEETPMPQTTRTTRGHGLPSPRPLRQPESCKSAAQPCCLRMASHSPPEPVQLESTAGTNGASCSTPLRNWREARLPNSRQSCVAEAAAASDRSQLTDRPGRWAKSPLHPVEVDEKRGNPARPVFRC